MYRQGTVTKVNVSVSSLPMIIKHKIISFFLLPMQVFNMKLISKSWNTTIKVYNQWLKDAIYFYDSIDSPIEKIRCVLESIEKMNYSLLVMTKLNKFNNFIGMNLCKFHHIWVSNILSLITDEGLEFDQVSKSLIDLEYRKTLVETLSSSPLVKIDQIYILWKTCLRYIDKIKDDPLGMKNFHPRDYNVIFFGDNDKHHYKIYFKSKTTGLLGTYNSKRTEANKKNYDRILSVTTFIGILYEEFDEGKVAEDVINSPKSRYYGWKHDDVIEEWRKNRFHGSQMHNNLENYYKGLPYISNIPEFALFSKFQEKYVTGKLIPYRTEWCIYDLEIGLVGAVDILYERINEEGKVNPKDGKKHLIMGDYKFVKALWESSFDGKGGSVAPTYKTPDCNWMHYCVQLCLYKYILEKNYNVIIDEMYLIILHHDQKEFIKKDIPWVDQFMNDLIAYRKSQFNEKNQIQHVNII
jgi:hypothetical protein